MVKAVCGISSEHHGSLLSSVPVEMVFNDMRDACKRHSKQEVTTGCNIHSIVARSCEHRTPALQPLNPSASDWSLPLPGKTLKRSVFDPSRCTDLSLGISTSGLTGKKSITDFTKPHVFAERLLLKDVLFRLWKNNPEEFDIEATTRKLWISSLAERGVLLKMEAVGSLLMVLKSGLYSARCLSLFEVTEEDECVYCVSDKAADLIVCDVPIQDINTYKVCCSSVSIGHNCGKLVWKPVGDWMLLTEYVAHHSILRVSASTLTALCSLLKLKGYSKLNHRKKAELYLKHFGVDDELIQTLVQQIPEKAPRAPKKQDDEEGDDEDQDSGPPKR